MFAKNMSSVIKKRSKRVVKKHKKSALTLLALCFLPFGASHAGWEVSWIEKFDGNNVDPDNWTAQPQANYNNEIQCYTDNQTPGQSNYEVSEGTLKITARRQSANCFGVTRDWTSGRLNSKDKAEFLYGRIEARLRFSDVRGGTWPAFWMLGNRIAEDPIKGDNDNVNWPNPGAGEIDVWEWYGQGGDSYITNFYNAGGASCGHAQAVLTPYQGGAPDVMTFETYAIEWTADEINFFMNDTLVRSQNMSNCAQYEEPMFILLNVAMGGLLGDINKTGVDPTLNEATLEVDYVAHCVATDKNDFRECSESTPVAGDDDNDGVSNSLDQCPNTDADVDVDAVGCEIVPEPTPQQSATDPTQEAGAVISIYSDSFNNIANVNYNPNWAQATTVTEEQIDGNNVLKYTGLNYQGIEFINNSQDVSSMDTLYIDYWTPNATILKIYLISPGPVEASYDVTVVQEEWQSLVIPLSTFESVVDLSDVIQIKIEGGGTVYVDNVFFGTEASAPPPVVVPPAPAPQEPSPEPTSSSGGGMPLSLIVGLIAILFFRKSRL